MITIVTGLSRCGSSLMMQMLYAGGMPLHPNASFLSGECDETLRLEYGDTDWLDEVEGGALKVPEPQHLRLPTDREYRFIWMRRDETEQAKSCRKFMRWVTGSEVIPANKVKHLAASIKRDTPNILAMLREDYHPAEVREFRFEDVLGAPLRLSEYVAKFCGWGLDVEAMAAVVKQRPAKCLPYMLEERLAAERGL